MAELKPDKQVKKEFKLEASAHPDKYYAVSVLKAEGFSRKKCSCGTQFWTVNPVQEVCGDAECSGGFRLFEKNPCKKKMDYITVWREFSAMFEKKGYKVLNRYPVVARWNPTMDFTIASIAAFQPYVVNGEVDPPAKKLVIPQFCLRFGDVDNVGITMSHMTGFVMIGQHMFVPPNEWDQEKAFQDILDWLTEGLGLPKEEVTFHEDAWAGGGNFGPCMEYFSRGVELGNQVYMMYEQTPDGPRELKLKVLDMGMGHERNAWFSQGKGTIYDATFPTVVAKLKKATGIKYDEELMHKYVPYAAYLNLDEVEDIASAWEEVAKHVGTDVEHLRQRIEPMTAIYSIAEHARSLLFALADGGLPSNVGGSYNLRVVFRRAQGFIDRFGWDVDMAEVAAWHAEYLKPLFPELLANIEDVKKILGVEREKYYENKKKSRSAIEQALKKPIATERLIELYDSQGVAPDEVARIAKEQGVAVTVPDNFYQLVAERHEQAEQKTQTRKKTFFAVDGLPKTKVLYYGAHDAVHFTANVLRILPSEGDRQFVVLDQTAFYPTSGGQEHDTGTLGSGAIVDVFKQDGIILHVAEGDGGLAEGKQVSGTIDLDRRHQLAQHHTTTHIVNGAARRVLGNHVWQAGAAKTVEKGRIDITHYETLTPDELKRIEEEANRIVAQAIPISKELVRKNRAEEAHGFRLYQGGAVPGAEIRVVDIPGFDVEACGGTHLENTLDAGPIRILRSTKVQDGVIRIEFVAGNAARTAISAETDVVAELGRELGCGPELIAFRCRELFEKWKLAGKGKLTKEEAVLSTHQLWTGDPVAKAAEFLRTQPEHVLKTVRRFKADIEKAVNK